jgi:hypothetical protein
VSAFIGAAAALLGVPLTQHVTRKSTHSHWLRETRVSAYADPVESWDNLTSVMLRLTNGTSDEQMQRFKQASVNFRRAISITNLYAPEEICDLMVATDDEFEATVRARDPDFYSKGFTILDKIRPRILDLAREELHTL